MTAPTRMPRYSFSNDGMGPYAIFYCDRCSREYRSTPAIAETVKDNVTRGALGGFLRNVPLVGNAAANQIENDRYRSSMSASEVQSAWGQVSQYFRECPTCHQIVCIPDFDEVTGFCNDDSPRAAEVEAAKAQQAAATLKGVADAFGLGSAVSRGMAQVQAQAAAQQAAAGPPPAGGPPTAGGPPPAPPAAGGMPPEVRAAMVAGAMNAAAGMTPCATCGTMLAAGAKFCANCGTPVAQARICKNCGTELAAGAKFCANCGTPAA
jgi:Double zinc ribbon